MRKIFTLLLSFVALSTYAQRNPSDKGWVTTWATATQFTTKDNRPKTELNKVSVRQIVHVSLGGNVLNLRLSNGYGDGPLKISSVYIADVTEGRNINPKTAKFLTFGGISRVTIEAGATATSDPVKYKLKPQQRLAITINYISSPNEITSHPGSRTTSYIIDGEAGKNTSFDNAKEEVDHWYNIDAIHVFDKKAHTIAVLGNSITDGRGSTTNMQNRWTDIFAENIAQTRNDVGVINLGIGGNCVLRGGLGDPAVKRFDRDIMQQAGVKEVIIFEGVNDIGNDKGTGDEVAKALIAQYEKFIAQVKAADMRVYGATITPFNGHYYYTPEHEHARQLVNEWIRNCGKFDAIIDFDLIMCDPERPDYLRKDYQEDWLHPNAEGYKRMGEYAAKVI